MNKNLDPKHNVVKVTWLNDDDWIDGLEREWSCLVSRPALDAFISGLRATGSTDISTQGV